jgi:hypothetical protein
MCFLFDRAYGDGRKLAALFPNLSLFHDFIYATPKTFVGVTVKLSGGETNWLYVVSWVPEKL